MIAFHDRQTDAVSAIFSCMRFIHFIELIPQFRHILLRDRPTTVEYGNVCVLPLSSDPHLNPLLIFCMVDGVRQIIRITCSVLNSSAHTSSFLIRHKINRCARLLSQDLTACDHAAHQAYDVKALELHLIRTEFQLIEVRRFFTIWFILSASSMITSQ